MRGEGAKTAPDRLSAWSVRRLVHTFHSPYVCVHAVLTLATRFSRLSWMEGQRHARAQGSTRGWVAISSTRLTGSFVLILVNTKA